jgi:hypothetical protein
MWTHWSVELGAGDRSLGKFMEEVRRRYGVTVTGVK